MLKIVNKLSFVAKQNYMQVATKAKFPLETKFWKWTFLIKFIGVGTFVMKFIFKI